MKKRKGLGLYSYEQRKYSTPFGLFVVIIIGTAIFLTGVGKLSAVLRVRQLELERFGSPEPHLWGFVVAVATIIMGVFLAHPGIIFWARRLLHRPDR